MALSRNARLMSGVTLLLVPTVMYGGLTLLGVLTGGSVGLSARGLKLSETQWALWRAGHAHAGVWTVFSVLLQVLLDSTHLSAALTWVARICAPLSAIALSAGFFGIAFSPSFRWLLYLGICMLLIAVLTTAVGLLRRH
jgi:hypothetical protein